jgi:hypothetical protein
MVKTFFGVCVCLCNNYSLASHYVRGMVKSPEAYTEYPIGGSAA